MVSPIVSHAILVGGGKYHSAESPNGIYVVLVTLIFAIIFVPIFVIKTAGTKTILGKWKKKNKKFIPKFLFK